MLTFCVLSDITLFQQFNYVREETPSVSMQHLCFVRILHYGITDKWKPGVCPTGSVEFVPTLCLCSAVSCWCLGQEVCPAAGGSGAPALRSVECHGAVCGTASPSAGH